MKDDSFDCTLIAHLRIFLLFYRLLYCLILPENRLFFGIWKVVEIDTEYAGILHGNQLNPYSQCLIRENGKNIWCIKTLTEEAYEQIIQPMSEVKSVVFKKSGRDVGVTKWQMDRCEERE